ncbi:ABC transporter permease subunit [Litorivicinus lipolyticus]|uniref:ABC transporter permease subunit n=1 Tax=Litorivicinus lipolyticus TaxID=418701 RepID=A0A5Q2QE62_9GAMM|nr:sugar ABC transporter permease [Litorivicinus lipolyticus]QGG80150.1 ABC transporter permease subunit [Litorivicinus lipolyticus]
MKHRSFFWFMLPSALAMLVFIAAPIVSVVIQSVYAPHEQVIKEVENCSIFGCTTSTTVDQEATRAKRGDEPLGRFVGTQIYTDRNHLATEEIGVAWQASESFGDFYNKATNLPFYGAMSFTLTYTAVVTPMAIILGFFIALGVNGLPKVLRGPTIFFSLLPMIVTPLVGALILFWMIDSRGVLGVALQSLLADPNLSLKASTPMMWVTLIVYGVWSSCPFAFVVYYAGLQTVPQDSIESAKLDGASRWQQTWHIIIPHLVPLTTFMALIKIMDNFRVFEPIVSFNAQAHAQSLSSFIYSDLGGETQLLSSAAATSVLTIVGVVILLSPVLVRTWRDYGKAR